jgi:hypothetical protein
VVISLYLLKQNDYYVLVAQNLLVIRQIVKVIRYKSKEYNSIYDNDIALLKLEGAVDFIKCDRELP